MQRDAEQRILITGANRGIGLEFTRQYLARGAQVFATARSPHSAADLHALAAPAGRLTVLPLDTGDAQSIAALSAALAAHTPALDLLINNAGTNPRTPEYRQFGELTPDALLDTLRVNAVGPLLLAQALVELLRAGTQPCVVNISSQQGSMEWKKGGGGYAYASSKAALNMFTRLLAADLRSPGITVITVHPGWVQTDMGGSSAPLTAPDAVRSMITLFDRLTPEHSGGFYRWDGSTHPW